MLLTGDNARAATQLADTVGITDVGAGLLPQDKAAAVRDLEAGGARMLLVGDGINDAPAMATAHVSIAMGRTGSDLALDTADGVITRDDLSTLPAVVALARRARRVVVANLTIAATFIVVLVTWDLVGHLPLPLGVAGHEDRPSWWASTVCACSESRRGGADRLACPTWSLTACPPRRRPSRFRTCPAPMPPHAVCPDGST